MSPPAAPAPRPVSVRARRGSRASGQRAFSPSFRRNEHGLVVPLSPLRQTRSSHQHNRPSQGSSLSILTERRDELASPHSITSSVRARSVGGTVRLSVFAVLRLTARRNLVGCFTGKLAGFSPLRILPA